MIMGRPITVVGSAVNGVVYTKIGYSYPLYNINENSDNDISIDSYFDASTISGPILLS